VNNLDRMKIYLDNCCFNRPFDDQTLKILIEKLGNVDAEKFVSLIIREPFNYTNWRKNNLFEGMSVDEISKSAMDYYNSSKL
jgi:hypothetical protein